MHAEGDVVWQAARRLHKALAGRTLTRSDFRVPRLATADLTGDVVTETVSRGKHLLTAPRTASPFTPTCAWTATGGPARGRADAGQSPDQAGARER